MKISTCRAEPSAIQSKVMAVMAVLVLGSVVLKGVAAELGGRDCVRHRTTNDAAINKLCAGRARLVEVGQNTSIDLSWDAEDANLTDVVILEVYVQHENVAETPPEVTVGNSDHNSFDRLEITGKKAGKTVISFGCERNETNKSSLCPFSYETLSNLKREVSYVNYLPLEVCGMIVGWIYAIFLAACYHPQTFHNFKRRSVVGFDFNYVGMNFGSHIAYLTFNVGLYWIPAVQDEYFRLHPEGVNPVQLNDVIFSVNATVSVGIWILQCIFLKRDGQRLSYVGGIFISVQWMVIVTSVLLGTFGALTWLNALYIISYITLVTTTVKYVPVVWINFRRKSTEGFSPYATILNLIGGAFSILQMFIIAYNYDDWKSIFGDPTKFGYGVLTVTFQSMLFFQHYFLYRRAWMKKYKMDEDCECSEVDCKHSMPKKKSVTNTVALPDKKIVLKNIEYYA